jgi:nucleotidyltransferase/DNA polymerase involved in DNA repair
MSARTSGSAALPVPGVGRARWLLELIRCRAGESADFVVGRVMSRVVSLYLPTWPTDRLRRKMGAAAPDGARPLVLVGQVGRRRDVVAANAIAIQAGLRVGMPATRAQALVNELVIQPADPAADAEALERLAIWALRYSPIVAADNPDGLINDATGTSHLHGGLTPADAPLIDAEKLFREPGPPHREGVLGYLGRAGRARKKRTAYGPE